MQIQLPPLKKGVTTTEFWIVVLGSLLLASQSVLNLLDTEWAAGGMTALGLIYMSIRGKLKSIHAQAAADQLKAQSDSARTSISSLQEP